MTDVIPTQNSLAVAHEHFLRERTARFSRFSMTAREKSYARARSKLPTLTAFRVIPIRTKYPRALSSCIMHTHRQWKQPPLTVSCILRTLPKGGCCCCCRRYYRFILFLSFAFPASPAALQPQPYPTSSLPTEYFALFYCAATQ